MMEMFIKSIQFDDQKRIIVKIQDHLAEHLAKEDAKKQLKEMVVQSLGDDFVQLEVAKTSCRVTVKEGTEEAAKAKIEEEIKKTIEVAMNFMNELNKQQENN